MDQSNRLKNIKRIPEIAIPEKRLHERTELFVNVHAAVSDNEKCEALRTASSAIIETIRLLY